MNYLFILITLILSGGVSPEKPAKQNNVGSPRLLFANRKDIRLLDTQSRRANTTVVVRDLVEATAVDVNVQSGIICWSDIEAEKIQCQSGIGGHGKKNTLVWSSLPSPEDIAMDTLTDKLYWTDSENNRIEVVCLKTKLRKVIIWEDIDQPRAISLDTNFRILFWTDWGEYPKIERSSMDGGNRKVIVDKDIFWPNGLALDEIHNYVYWVDAKLHYIARVDYNGQNRRLINEDSPLHPFSLAYYNNVLYWSDWHTNSLHSIRLDTNATKQLPTKSNINPMDIVIYEPRNDSNRFNPCATSKCSHLCILSESQNFTCACPIGVKLINETHCNDGIDEYLIIARGQDIRRISLDTTDFTDVILGFNGIKHLLAVDYWNGSVYWTDDEARKIRKGSLTDFETTDIITEEIVHPDGLAIDWVGQNLYWTDAGTDRIEVSRLNGQYRKILVSRGLNEPRAITLDPAKGLIFWSDWGKKPRIERANMDGTGRLSIIVDNIFWPNGIAVDHGIIYWCDANYDRIEMAAYDGSNRRELITEDLPHTFGFTLLGDYIYWTDWQRRTVERAQKTTGRDRIIIKELFTDPMGIVAVKPKAFNYTLNPCGLPHNCQHLCLYNSQSKEGNYCSCASGYELDKDNRSCTLPEAFILYSNNGDIHRVSLSQNSRSDIVPVKGKSPSALDYDATESRIYWTDTKFNGIFRAFMNGSHTETVIDYGVVHPEGLAIDWLNRNMYWTDMGKNRIDCSRLNGSYRRAIIWDNIEAPRAIIVQPQKGLLFWSSWSSTNRGIEKSGLNGLKRSMVVSGIGRAYGLAIEDDYIYWSDIDNYIIERMHLVTLQRNIVLRNTESLTFKPFSIATYQSSIYMQDTESSTILVYNMVNNTMQKLHHNVRSIQELKIYDKLKQHTTWTPCRTVNCSHICFTVQNKALTAVCACQSHYTLNDNHCEAPKQYILFSGVNHVSRYIDYDTIVFGGLRKIQSINADTEHIFYVSNGVLKKTKYPGQQSKGLDIAENVIEFSLHGDVVYYSSGNCVNVTTKEGTFLGYITCSEEDSQITHLKTYKSWLYYTVGSRMERTTLNGIKKLIVFNTTGTIGGFDIDDDMIYFSDMDMKKIFTCNLNGENRKVLASNLGGPTGIAVMNTYLYWLDVGGGMERMNKWSGVDRSRVLARNENLTSVVHVNTLQTINCHEDCTICGGDGSCTCPYGQYLSQDGKLCNLKMDCPSDDFQCHSGHVGCVHKFMVCNGLGDCQDGSDELHCDEQCNDVNSENCKMIQCTDDACKETPHHSDVTYILVPIFLVVIAILGILVVVVRRRTRARLNNHHPSQAVTCIGIPQNYPLRTTNPSVPQKSSSNSSSSDYISPLVPHPSPATTAGSKMSHYNCCQYNNKYYYVKDQVGVPPCTPCSTEACDNSELYAFNVPPPSVTSSPNSTIRMYVPPPSPI